MTVRTEIERDRVRANAEADARSWIVSFTAANGYLTEDDGHHGASVHAYRRFGPFVGLDDHAADLKSFYRRAFIATVKAHLAAAAAEDKPKESSIA